LSHCWIWTIRVCTPPAHPDVGQGLKPSRCMVFSSYSSGFHTTPRTPW
jgi:hypothetical protein